MPEAQVGIGPGMDGDLDHQLARLAAHKLIDLKVAIGGNVDEIDVDMAVIVLGVEWSARGTLLDPAMARASSAELNILEVI